MKEWSHYLRFKHNIQYLFSIVVISGDVGLLKPDPKIFKYLLEKLNAKPEDCVFIDDNLNNLESASKFGIKTLKFVKNAANIPYCSKFEISSFKELKYIIENHL